MSSTEEHKESEPVKKVVMNEGSIKRNHKRILVTGGCGFIGSHLIDRLMADEQNLVICVDNCFSGSKSNIAHWINHPRFEFIRHDVQEPLMAECDQIYHLACPASPVFYQNNGIRTIKTNVLGTLNMLGIAKRLKARILISSTSEVYGDPDVHPQVEEYWGNVNPIGIRSCYDEGKRIAETLCFEYNRQHGVEIRVARIFNCFPAEDHQLLTAEGFMTLADVDAHFAAKPTLAVACYVDGALQYHQITARDVTRGAGEHTFVEIVGESKKSAKKKNGEDWTLTNGVNIMPTGNHRMYTRIATVQRLPGGRLNHKHLHRGEYGITLAEDMLAEASENPDAHAFFKARFEAGIGMAAVALEFAADLGLDTRAKISAFLELYGYWLADGWLERGRLTFGPAKPADWAYVKDVLLRAGLQQTKQSIAGEPGFWIASNIRADGQRTIRVSEPAWFLLFAAEYGHKYHAGIAESVTSIKARSQARAQARARALKPVNTAVVLKDVKRALVLDSDDEVEVVVKTEATVTIVGDGDIGEAVKPEDVKSAKWFAPWVFERCDAEQCRDILKGYRFGDGCEKAEENKIYTSSVRMRDQLVQLALHAGHTAYWIPQNKAGQSYGVNKLGVTITATADSWCVLYGEQVTFTEPRVNIARECKQVKRSGTVWCVTVPAKDNLIMFRRVLETDAKGVVVRASRPVVVGNTYGPRMLENDGRVVSNFIVQALKGVPITIYGTGEQTRSFCYVSDNVTALIALMNGNQIGPINIGNPNEYTIKQLAEHVQKLINPKNAVVYKDVPSDDPRRRKPDISKAKKYLNWEPTVQLDEGLKKTIEDFAARHKAGDF